MYYNDVFGGPGALGMVHNRVFLQTWDTARGQHLVVLIHTQGLSSQIFYWERLTVTHTSCAINQHIFHSGGGVLRDYLLSQGLLKENV